MQSMICAYQWVQPEGAGGGQRRGILTFWDRFSKILSEPRFRILKCYHLIPGLKTCWSAPFSEFEAKGRVCAHDTESVPQTHGCGQQWVWRQLCRKTTQTSRTMYNVLLRGELKKALSGLASQLPVPGKTSAAQFLPHTYAATHSFSALSMQVDGEFKEKQIGTLFILNGAQEGFRGGSRNMGQNP
eukprot:938555-Pelagomonas_calceolata.AAC.1